MELDHQFMAEAVHFICSGAMVWTKLGRLVYGVNSIDLCNLIGEQGCACSEMVFAHSYLKPKVTAGV